MSGRKFLYGTHYSAPGYVLYYLVRAGIIMTMKGCENVLDSVNV